MFDTYLLIGATTPVGKYLVHEYSREGKSVRVLVPEESDVSEYEKIGAEVYYGSTFDKDSMRDFFKVAEPRSSVVIHVDPDVIGVQAEARPCKGPNTPEGGGIAFIVCDVSIHPLVDHVGPALLNDVHDLLKNIAVCGDRA